jgi:hypothetical protein
VGAAVRLWDATGRHRTLSTPFPSSLGAAVARHREVHPGKQPRGEKVTEGVLRPGCEIECSAGCFDGLEKAGLISTPLSRRLQEMARFSNLLVHVYWTIDYGRVFDVLEHDLDDLREFSRSVAGLI